MNDFIKRSLARQFSVLTIIIILVFSALISLLLVYQNQQRSEFKHTNEKLETKEKLAQQLDYAFNLAVSEMRAYFAYAGEPSYFQNVEKQQRVVSDTLAAFEGSAEDKQDLMFIQHTKDFYNYYFLDKMPKSKQLFDSGQTDAIIDMALARDGSDAIRDYQSSLKAYMERLDKQWDVNQEEQNKRIFASQLIFSAVLLLVIIGIGWVARRMLRQMGRPLQQLTMAASEIASGRNVVFTDRVNRQDELGLLSDAFAKMSKSIMEKEQNLSAQNDELVAQQEALQDQQIHLEMTVEKMQVREMDLKRRNDLVNGLANSLDKKTVLASIVNTMGSILDADKGVIVLLDKERDHASYGVSEQGIQQLIAHLDKRLLVRLKETKRPYAVKRESLSVEKAYHTTLAYSYDIYIPVLSATEQIEAMMLFTRYDQPFNEFELNEYQNLSKQIAISLEKLKLFEQTEEERALTQNILDTIKEGIQLVDTDGKIIQVNRQLCKMLDCNCETLPLMRMAYGDWIGEMAKVVKNGDEMRGFFDQMLFNQEEEQSSFVYHQHTPVERVVQVYCESLTSDGEKFGTVIVHRDITKEYEVDVMKSEFVSTVSHELRTPLASVLGFTELMLHKELKPERQKKYLTTIFQEAKRLTSLINDFLDVQRMEAGKQTYEKKYEDIVPIIERVIETYRVNSRKHTIHLEEQTGNTMILGDHDKLTQVFTNLISNAIKYSPEGGNVFVRVFENGSHLNVSIQDEGLGIPKEAFEKLFTKFYRIDNSDRRKIGGTGLGLAIVKEIVSAHGGDVTVLSAQGEGSLFTVSFPLVYQEVQQDSVVDRTGKASVFIVEDDASHAQLLEAELEESNFSVTVFSNGEDALTAAKKDVPEAIVLDIMLGEEVMDGWNFIERIKESDALKNVPIFISSALDDKEKGKALGANDYLIKPYQPSKLSNVIFQTLLQRNREGEIHIPAEPLLQTRPSGTNKQTGK